MDPSPTRTEGSQVKSCVLGRVTQVSTGWKGRKESSEVAGVGVSVSLGVERYE